MNSYELEQALACKQMEVEDLRQQVTLLRDELNTVYKLVPDLVPVMHPSALATTDDLSGYILCEKEPVAWEYFHSRAEPPLSVDFDDPDCIKAFPSDVVWKVPLYRAKEQGK